MQTTKKAKCENCGRVWSPRKPDAPKLKCPTCGKYKVEIFDGEMKEEVKDGSECDNNDGSYSGGAAIPGFTPPDLPDPGDRKSGENDLLLSGEKNPSPEMPVASSILDTGSPLEEVIIDPPGNPPAPSFRLRGGLWIGLAILAAGVVSALWYLYRKRSLVEDAEEILSEDPRPSGGGESDLYGRGRAAYRRGAF